MSELKPEDFQNEIDEDMTVTIDTDDGPVECSIITILTVNDKDYIALLPLDAMGNPSEEDVWFYGYSEDFDDPNAEPELFYIEDDDELDAVVDKFDEYLDEIAFNEMPDNN